MIKRFLMLASIFGTAVSAQVYLVTVTAGGSGYTTTPTVTSSGGSCSAQPTYVATTSSNAVVTVAVSYAGAGCTSAPTISFSGGGGSGATATGSLLPYSQVILLSVPTCSSQGIQACVGGGFVAYQYECDLVVPAARVKYYAAGAQYGMPGTSQGSQFQPASILPAAITADLLAGVLTIYNSFLVRSSSASVASVEADINTACAAAQTNLSAWNPWVNYSTFYNPITATWTALGAQ